MDSKQDSKAGKLLKTQALFRSWHSTTELLPLSSRLKYSKNRLLARMPTGFADFDAEFEPPAVKLRSADVSRFQGVGPQLSLAP